ncbi:glycoside hydrolase family 15 protein [Oryzifoliimicrobium ureilyticus]|uniref:glycoside hydrolase family 15 protein n=1 Tax=Oryzifoliimicrobium ureilyticus TaxID=3113724 RepID=UPI0030767BDE
MPLEHYAAVGDGRSVALVGADGSIDWWCAPNMDSPPLFNRLHDPDDGLFAVTPVDPFRIERRYRPDSNVLETVFVTVNGRARITESLNSGVSGRLPWCELARRIEGLEGEVEFRIVVKPAKSIDAGRRVLRHRSILYVGKLTTAFCYDDSVDQPVERNGEIAARHTTAPGSKTCLAYLVSHDSPLCVPDQDSIDSRIDLSDEEWKRWSGQLTYRGRFRDDLVRCALSLKFLLYSPTGAIAAAATAGLPERLGGDKNYDYRYAWVRDACYTVKALLRVGALAESVAAFSWLMKTVADRRHDPMVVYTLRGEHVPEETTINVPGYQFSKPVRVGNRASNQVQLSCFGDIFETAALFVSLGHILDERSSHLLADLADECVDRWRSKDSGIWELEQLQHYTFSKIGCWLALSRAVELSHAGHINEEHAAHWANERDNIRTWIDENCWSADKQSYVFFAGTDRLDAALLLTTRFGFEHDDRLRRTRAAIEKELSVGSLVYRYTGAEREEGAFVACSCWLVEAYAFLGEPTEAETRLCLLLEKLGNNFGLLGEEIDPLTGAALGNMPQGLSHLALLHAILSIQENS